jgi:hypothetical protein
VSEKEDEEDRETKEEDGVDKEKDKENRDDRVTREVEGEDTET